MLVEKRKNHRTSFRLIALEHRPSDSNDALSCRQLICLNFSKLGACFGGNPRYSTFEITLPSPHDISKFRVCVEVKYIRDDRFGVSFINPSQDLVDHLSRWE